MDAGVILGILATMVLIICLVGTIGFKKFRDNWGHIVSIGQAYIAVTGMMLTVVIIASLIRTIFTKAAFNGLGFVLYLAVAAWGLFVLFKAEQRCETKVQKIWLPIICWFIAMGFAWRVVISLITHSSIPGGDGGSFSFPSNIRDQHNNRYYLQSVNGDCAHYINSDNNSNEVIYVYARELNGDTITR